MENPIKMDDLGIPFIILGNTHMFTVRDFTSNNFDVFD